jgi:hypothetical protein
MGATRPGPGNATSRSTRASIAPCAAGPVVQSRTLNSASWAAFGSQPPGRSPAYAPRRLQDRAAARPSPRCAYTGSTAANTSSPVAGGRPDGRSGIACCGSAPATPAARSVCAHPRPPSRTAFGLRPSGTLPPAANNCPPGLPMPVIRPRPKVLALSLFFLAYAVSAFLAAGAAATLLRNERHSPGAGEDERARRASRLHLTRRPHPPGPVGSQPA